MLLAARRDEDFDTCGLSLHLRPAIAVLTGDPSLRRGPRLQATAASSAPRPFIYAFAPCRRHGRRDPRRRPQPLAPRRSPRPPAPAPRPCIYSVMPHRGSMPCPAATPPSGEREGRGGSAPPRALAPWAEHQKGGSRRRGEGRLHGLGNGRSAGWVGGGEWDGLRGEWRCREPSGREIEDCRENNYYEMDQTQRVVR